MLLVQDICLFWHKEERNAAYAKVRAEFPRAYLLDQIPDTFRDEVLVQRLIYGQKGIGFQEVHVNGKYRFMCLPSVQDLNLANISIRFEQENYEVTFFYDIRRSGRPVRRGHNKDYHNVDSPLYRHDILNETAFSLKRGQYGRVIWNERKLDCDTGEWYYQLHVINFLHSLNQMPETDIFLSHTLDFEYYQMAVLH